MTEKNISRRRALGFAAKTAGVAGAASVAMSVNASMAQAAPKQDDWLPNAWNTIAASQGDQFPEIQAALDRAEEEGGGIVHLESGTFRIGNTLSIGENVTLQGTGAGTELRATGGMPWMVQFPASSFLAALKDIRLFGGGSVGGVNVVTAGRGVVSGNDAYVLIENVIIHDVAFNGVRVGTFTQGFNTRAVCMHNVVVLRSQSHGILFSGVDSIVSSCVVGVAGLDGFHIDGGNNRLTGCKAFFCSGSGITVNGSRGQLSACESQDNEGDGIKIDGANNVALSACVADSNQFVGVRIRNCRAVTFSSVSSFSRGGGRFAHRFGVRIQNSSNCLITGVSDNNSTNLNVVNSPTVDLSGLLT